MFAIRFEEFVELDKVVDQVRQRSRRKDAQKH